MAWPWFIWIVPIVGITTGIVYLKLAKPESTLTKRLTTSAYGPVIALMYLLILMALPRDYRYKEHVALFEASLIVPVVLMVVSAMGYPGPNKVHALIPVNLVGVALLWVAGTITIAGK